MAAAPNIFDITGMGGIGLLSMIDPSQLTPEQQQAYLARKTATDEANRNYLLTQGLLGAGLGLLNASGPSRIPVSMGQAFGQGVGGFASGMSGAQTALANQAKGELDKAKTIQEIQTSRIGNAKAMNEMEGETLKREANMYMAGIPLDRLPSLSKMLGGQASAGTGASTVAAVPYPAAAGIVGARTAGPVASPAVGMAAAVPGLLAAEPGQSGPAPSAPMAPLPYDVLTGQVPPTPEQAMRMANIAQMAGNNDLASKLRSYAFSGEGGFRFNGSWNQMAPIGGSKEDPNYQRDSAAAGRLMQRDANGNFVFSPGVVSAEAGKAATTSGAEAQARSNVELRMGPQIAAAKAAAEEGARKPFRVEKENREAEMKVLDDLNAQQPVKDYKNAVGFHNSMVDAYVNNNTQAGDYLLVVSTAKVLDPASVAREGEVEIVRGSGPIGSRLTGYYNFLQGGGRLSDTQKKELLDMVGTKATSLQETYNAELAGAKERATRYGLDPRNIAASLPELRTIKDSVGKAIESGKLAPENAPGAIYDPQRKGWIVPQTGMFYQKGK